MRNEDIDITPNSWGRAADYHRERIGHTLKKTRLEQNLTLEDVANVIRVRRVYLEAIEEGYYDKLPGEAYAIGFVRLYSSFLHIDSSRAVEQFRAEASGQNSNFELELPLVEERSTTPKLLFIIVGLLIVVLAYAAYLLGNRIISPSENNSTGESSVTTDSGQSNTQQPQTPTATTNNNTTNPPPANIEGNQSSNNQTTNLTPPITPPEQNTNQQVPSIMTNNGDEVVIMPLQSLMQGGEWQNNNPDYWRQNSLVIKYRNKDLFTQNQPAENVSDFDINAILGGGGNLVVPENIQTNNTGNSQVTNENTTQVTNEQPNAVTPNSAIVASENNNLQQTSTIADKSIEVVATSPNVELIYVIEGQEAEVRMPMLEGDVITLPTNFNLSVFAVAGDVDIIIDGKYRYSYTSDNEGDFDYVSNYGYKDFLDQGKVLGVIPAEYRKNN